MEDQALFNQPNDVKEIKKRRMLNISEKVELIKLMQNSTKKKKDIAALYGIPVNTVGAIYANRERILEKCKGDFTNMNCKRLRPSTYPDIEEGLLDWYIENHTNGHISCLTLRTKALEVAKALGHDNFTASNGWIERFKARHNLKFKRNKDKKLSSIVLNSSNNETSMYSSVYITPEKSDNGTSVKLSNNDTSMHSTGNDISHSGNSSEVESFNQFESQQNQVWANISNPAMTLTEIKQECDDSYSFNNDCHTSSNQDESDRIRESSPSPSHLIPEVHLMETVSDNDNQVCLQNNSHSNLDYDMNHCNMAIQNVENAFNIILTYVDNCDEKVGEKTLGALKDLKTFISNEKKRKSQSKITDYFSLV